jgi:hypothetical protein
LDNLRTEIVLKDADDVAFWFSFIFPVAMFREKSGKPDFSVTHQTLVKLNDLFPKKPKYGERLKFGEDESISRD